jgi:hypothetical protein
MIVSTLYKLFAPLAFFTFSILQAGGQTDCDLKVDKDSVKVYSCAADSKFRSIRAILNVKSTPRELIDIVLNVNDYNNWQYHTIHAHVLEYISARELYYYTEIVSPWPASNRDLVVHLKIEHNDEARTVLITAHSVPDFIPEKEGIVRVPMSQSQWRVQPLNESTLSVEFTMLVDPGGSVPAWLINMVAAQAPYESFRNFKKKIEGK